MKVYIGFGGHTAVVVDENPKFKRVLRSIGGAVDVVRTTPEEWTSEKWRELDNAQPISFAHTFLASSLAKTARAAKAIQDIIDMTDLNTLSMAQLVTEYNRVSGKKVARFESKAAAVAAITKQQQQLATASDPAAPVEAPSTTAEANPAEEQTMTKTATKKTTAKKTAAKKTAAEKPAKKTAGEKPAAAPKKAKPAAAPKKAKKAASGDRAERAAKVAQMVKGSGGLIVKLLKQGKLDDDGIISAVLKEFPDRKVSGTQISWYRSMLTAAGAI